MVTTASITNVATSGLAVAALPANLPASGLVRCAILGAGDAHHEIIDIDLASLSTLTFGTFAREVEEATALPKVAHASAAGIWFLLTKDGLLAGVGGVTDYVYIRDEKAQNTSGGTFTLGLWRTRDLNTKVTDTGGICTLAANQFTLPAGTYRILASAPAYDVKRHQTRLYNVTDSAVTLLGTSEYLLDTVGGQTRSIIAGIFTIAASKVFEFQHQCEVTTASNGFGVASNFTTEVYAEVEIWRGAAVTGGIFGGAGSGNTPSARATGSGGGDHTTTSTTLVNIHASAYDLVVAAVAGDVIEIAGTLEPWYTGTKPRITFALDVGGTALDRVANHAPAVDGEVQTITFQRQHVVTSGQISGGTVTIRPQWRTSTGTARIENSGDSRPHFTVKNLRQ